MADYRRFFVPGGTYFFTLVAEGRATIFSNAAARSILGNVMRRCRSRFPFETLAIVLLPDHLHAIWALPAEDFRYSGRWGWIKKEFTKAWLPSGGTEQPPSGCRRRERRRGVWQRRFWEHTIRDETDLEAHVDYIHYNPVKHGLVRSPRDWPWSTFHRWVAVGHYSVNWAAGSCVPPLPGNAGE